MVDTIKCQSELDLTELFFEKLLLGAIDTRFDRKELEAHDPTKYDQEAHDPIPHRAKAPSTGRESQWSGDTAVVGSSSRGNSFYTNRSSTMRTPIESPVGATQSAQAFERNPSNLTSFRHALPPLDPPRRHTTINSTIEETEESEPRAPPRSSTSGTHSSRWWKPRSS